MKTKIAVRLLSVFVLSFGLSAGLSVVFKSSAEAAAPLDLTLRPTIEGSEKTDFSKIKPPVKATSNSNRVDTDQCTPSNVPKVASATPYPMRQDGGNPHAVSAAETSESSCFSTTTKY